MQWRSAGLTYLRYSQIAAAVARACTKQSASGKMVASADATLKITKWENGKPAIAASK